ncbi:hypothetical protein WOLCODRAFT_20684 [Wolfiporia cocos MD-104 SS10]|uniref:Uncharacterized protein n=1 Tax=Wolfiporia cocos (strain MD-104) TaxID=742152 RepID=A0A2H3J3Y5_WOLCO|nr:hypothetical protein WOLCODRAFT_20684 [Wolfiporia cocos MD-104 SS10]
MSKNIDNTEILCTSTRKHKATKKQVQLDEDARWHQTAAVVATIPAVETTNGSESSLDSQSDFEEGIGGSTKQQTVEQDDGVQVRFVQKGVDGKTISEEQNGCWCLICK